MNKSLARVDRTVAPAILAGLTSFAYALALLGYEHHYFAQFYSQLNHIIALALGVLSTWALVQSVWLNCLLRAHGKDASMAIGAAAKGLGGTDLENHAGAAFAPNEICLRAATVAAHRPTPPAGGRLMVTPIGIAANNTYAVSANAVDLFSGAGSDTITLTEGVSVVFGTREESGTLTGQASGNHITFSNIENMILNDISSLINASAATEPITYRQARGW